MSECQRTDLHGEGHVCTLEAGHRGLCMCACGHGMTDLERLPRCPDCDRILRTRDNRPWCIDCQRFTHDQEPT